MKKLTDNIWAFLAGIGVVAVVATVVAATTPNFRLASGQVLIGNASNQARPLALSGDVTMTNAGAVTIAARSVESTMIHPGFTETFGEATADAGLAVFQADGTVYDGTAGVINDIYTGNGHKFLWFPIVGQTLLPVTSTTGLNIGADQTDNDGAEIFSGLMGASGRPVIIGTDPAVSFCAAVTIADVSGTDDFHVGWRRIQDGAGAAAPAIATFDNYTDFATIGIATSADPAAIQLETALNNAATTTTDTTNTVADGVSKTYCVLVSAAGVVTYTNDGAAPTVTAAFTFDDGDMIIPFIHYLHSLDVAGAITITDWAVTLQ